MKKRIMALLLTAVMAISSVDLSVYAMQGNVIESLVTQEEETQEYVESDSAQVETKMAEPAPELSEVENDTLQNTKEEQEDLASEEKVESIPTEKEESISVEEMEEITQPFDSEEEEEASISTEEKASVSDNQEMEAVVPQNLMLSGENTVPKILPMEEGELARGEIENSVGTITWVIDATGKLIVEGSGELVSGTHSTSNMPWNSYKSRITSAEIKLTNVEDLSYLFYYCSNLVSVDLTGTSGTNLTNMQNMFAGCSKLESVNFGTLDTSKVTDMSYLFSQCGAIETLNLGNLNTASVTTMYNMFQNCKNLKSLNISGFDTSKVTNMQYMFGGCSSLASLNVTGFNTSLVTNLSSMFEGCSSLRELDLSSFNTTNVTTMASMFKNCNALISVDLSSFNTGNVTTMTYMFNNCKALEEVDVTGFNTEKVTSISNMFDGCSSLTEINLSSFNTAAVTSMHSMFQNCSNLIEINLGHFNTEKATSLSNMFNGCSSLEKVNLSGFNTSNITGYTGMFKDCSSLRTVDLSNFDFSKVSFSSNTSNMFAGTTLLTKIYTPKNVNVDVALPEGVWNSKGEQNVTLLPKEKTTSEVFALGTTPTAEIDAFVVFNTDNTRKPTIKVRFHGLEAGDIDKITSFTLKIDNGDNLAGDDWKTNYVEAAGEYTQTITQELDFGDHTITVSVAGTSSLGTKEIQSVFTIPGVTLYSGNVVTEKGTLSWRINSAGELTVKGKGDLDDKGTNRSKENIPWYEHRALVKTAVISLSETENFSYLLADCTSLTTVDFSGTDTAATTNMTGMFSGSSSIGKLDLSSFTMENVAQAANMFTATTALTELYLPKNIPAAFSELTSLGLAQGTEATNKWYDCEGQEVTAVPTQKTYSDLWKKGTTPTAELRVLVKENIDNFRKPIVEVSFVGLDPETGMSSLKFVVDSDKEISVTDWQSLYNEETRVLSYTFSENLNAGSHVLKAVVTTNNTNTLEAEAEFTVRKSAVSMSVSAEEKELRKPLVKVKFIGLQDPSDILSLEITLQEVVMASPSNPSPSQMTVTVPVENWANYYNADTNEFSYQVQQELKTGEFRAKAVVTISNNITMTSKEATGSFTIAPSGTINNSKGGITWAIDSNGKLTVTGKGEIESGEGDRAAIDIPWNQYKAQITSAEISLSEIQDLSQLLNGCSNLLTVDISNLNTEATTNMKSMFNGCSKLTTITGLTAEGIDTSNVTTMESMFYGCKKLESLDLSNFDTIKVENMKHMFYSCTSLGALDVSSFDTEKVTDMSYIFYSCESLENLNINNFKTPLVTKMTSMFYNCKELTTLNLSNLDTSKITDMSSMFSGCNGLTSLNLSSFNTELVTNMNYMFRNCSSLEQINVSSFNTANVTTMSNMFFGCSSLTSLDLSSFDLSQVVYGNSQTPLSGFIGGLTSLTTLKTPKNISDTWNNTSAIQLPSKDGYFWFVEGVGEVTSMAVGQSQSQTIIRKERENITYVTMDLAVEETATEGRPIIKVIFTDLENPQDITGFNLTINNGSNLVTGDWKQNYNTATKTFTYQPQEALAPGSYTVKVSVVTDLPMLVKEKTKTFTVEEPEVINVTMDLTVEETETAGKPMIKVTFTGLENANDITSLALTLNNGANLITGNWQNNYNASTKTFTYQPQEALAPGNYTVKVTVVTNLPMQEKEKTASFTVVAPDVTSVSMELTVEETTTVGKPMIKVTFTGLENASDITSLSLTLNNGENLITGDWKEKYDTATKTFTWQPDQVLEPGDYTVKVSVETSLPMSVKEKTASFTVSGTQPPIGGETTLEFNASLSMDREGGLRIRAWKKSDAITKIEAQITQNFPEAESIVETPVAMNYVDNYYTRYAVLKEGISGISVKITAYNEAGETTEKVIPLTEPNIETEAVNDLWVRFLDGYGEDNKNYVYTGSAIKPKVQVYEATTLLTEKKDYTLSYKNNTNVYEGSDNGKLPQVIVNGKGNYKGKEIAVFTIVPKDIENEDAVETLQTVTIADMSAIAKNKEQKLVPVITYGKKKLTNKKNKDFEVTYPDTVEGAYQKPGSYTVKVEGKNNYRGIIEIDFTIGGKLMKNMKVSKIANQTYTGSEITIPDLTVSDGKTPLVRGQHYELEPVNNIEIGKATIIIKAVEGQYDYVGSKTVTFNIVGTAISKATVDPDSLPKSVVYDGQEKEPEIKLTWKKDKNATAVPLVKGTDYEVDYDKNLDAGTATVIITGKGRFSGTMKKTFKILPFDAKTNEGSKLSVEKGVEITYAKGGAKPQPQVTFGDVLLKEGVDYTLSYSNNKAVTQSSTAKKPQVKVTFKKNFKGSLSEEFTILPQDISKVTILAQDKVYSTKKNGWKTTVTLTDLDGKKLTAGTDYEKAFTYYTDEACTTAAQAETYETGTVLWVKVEGKNNYAGSSITGSYRIVKASVAKATVKVAPQYYTSEAITLNKNDLTVKIGGTTLEYGVDYIIVEDSYINNIKKGTAKVQIKGIGDNYGGVKTVSFSIKQKSFLFRLLPQLFQR